jgi:hypothetical protein
MQSQKLLPRGKVLQEEFFSGAKGGDDPSQAEVEGTQTLGDHSEKRAAQVRLQVIDSADPQSFGEAQAFDGGWFRSLPLIVMLPEEPVDETPVASRELSADIG